MKKHEAGALPERSSGKPGGYGRTRERRDGTRWLCLCLLAALCLTGPAGCAAGEQEEPECFRLWFTNDLSDWSPAQDTDALVTVDYQGKQTVPQVMAALLVGPPQDSGLSTPIPAETYLLGWALKDGVLQVDLSEAYNGLVGVDLTLADYCVALTLAQLEGVEGVRITVNGSEPLYRDQRVLYPGDVVLSGAEEEPVEVSAALYFRRADSGELGYELRMFRLTESEDPVLAVLRALLAGPEDEGLTPLLPEGLTVNAVRVDDGVCSLDLSADLLDGMPQDEAGQRLVLDALVNTLCSLDTVQAVQLLVDGQPLEQYGAVDTSQPMRGDVP